MEGEPVGEAWIRERAGPQDSGTPYPPRCIPLPITTWRRIQTDQQRLPLLAAGLSEPHPIRHPSQSHGSRRLLVEGHG